jgi:hypothetical protein
MGHVERLTGPVLKASPNGVGGESNYLHQDVHRCTIRVTELVPGREIAWLVLDDHFNVIKDQSEWDNTELVPEISEDDAALTWSSPMWAGSAVRVLGRVLERMGWLHQRQPAEPDQHGGGQSN